MADIRHSPSLPTRPGRKNALSAIIKFEHPVVVLTGDVDACAEGGAEWPATGPENQANLTVKGSIPSPSANFVRSSYV